jgi:hypothetical protein
LLAKSSDQSSLFRQETMSCALLLLERSQERWAGGLGVTLRPQTRPRRDRGRDRVANLIWLNIVECSHSTVLGATLLRCALNVQPEERVGCGGLDGTRARTAGRSRSTAWRIVLRRSGSLEAGSAAHEICRGPAALAGAISSAITSTCR